MTPTTCQKIGCKRYQQLKKDDSDWCVLKLLIDQDGNERARATTVFSVSEKVCKQLRKTSPEFDPVTTQKKK